MVVTQRGAAQGTVQVAIADNAQACFRDGVAIFGIDQGAVADCLDDVRWPAVAGRHDG